MSETRSTIIGGRQRGRTEILSDAIRVCTEAARTTLTRTGRDGREHQARLDFTEFITHALSGTAANVGGIEQLLAGRAGSWEAGKVRDLLCGVLGVGEAQVWEYRTEPVTVRVHVESILSDLRITEAYCRAEDELDRREDALWAQAGQTREEIDEGADAEIDRLRIAVTVLQERDWLAYGEAFAVNVHSAAGELFPTMRAPVQVQVELDWQAELDSSEEVGSLEWRLWEHALRFTPLPGSGLRPLDYPLGADIAEVEREAGRDPLSRIRAESAGQEW